MTVSEAITGCTLSRPDAEILLAHLLGKDRTWIFAHGPDAMPADKEGEWAALVARRKAGEPIAYIVGRKEFYGRDFFVTRDTLVPRPATETLVAKTVQLLTKGRVERNIEEIDAGIAMLTDVWKDPKDAYAVADVGTGSGCIGISVNLELPGTRVIATDVSDRALEIAEKNAAALGAEIEFRKGDLLYPLTDIAEPFLLVSNPPYIPDGTPIDDDVRDFEPHDALFSGPDGMDALTRLVAEARAHPWCVGYVIECRMEQAKGLLA